MALIVGRTTSGGKVQEVKPLTRKQAEAAVRRQWHTIRRELPKDSYWRDTVRLLRHTAQRHGQYIVGFMDAIGCGFYPPPEVLFAVHDALETYLAADGKLSLEEAFFGKPTPKLGNYAARRHAERRKAFLALKTELLMRKGMSQIAAAENVGLEAEQRGYGAIDAETIARVHRDQPNLFRLRKKKAAKNPVAVKS